MTALVQFIYGNDAAKLEFSSSGFLRCSPSDNAFILHFSQILQFLVLFGQILNILNNFSGMTGIK